MRLEPETSMILGDSPTLVAIKSSLTCIYMYSCSSLYLHPCLQSWVWVFQSRSSTLFSYVCRSSDSSWSYATGYAQCGTGTPPSQWEIQPKVILETLHWCVYYRLLITSFKNHEICMFTNVPTVTTFSSIALFYLFLLCPAVYYIPSMHCFITPSTHSYRHFAHYFLSPTLVQQVPTSTTAGFSLSL